ncbi:hypothetical protein ASC63_11145 [Leifsonia sp. Root112D2]|nr:hypothetical protein ASC63_11145 [Leifsonia sp. Root112D2]
MFHRATVSDFAEIEIPGTGHGQPPSCIPGLEGWWVGGADGDAEPDPIFGPGIIEQRRRLLHGPSQYPTTDIRTGP